MSNITLSANAGGTGIFTIASPSSNTNRTLTLPDVTGVFNVSGAATEVPAGSASTPSIYPTGDTNTGIFFPAADTIAFTEGGTEVMRIDSFGNLNLTTSGSALQWSNASNNCYIAASSGTLQFATGTGGYVERARIDSSGNLLVGTTSQVGFNGGAGANINANGAFRNGVSGSGDSSAWQRSSTGNYLAFFYGALNSNPSTVGSINTNGTNTTYSTSSDYRLKEDIQPMTGALAKVAALKPVTYKWKSTGEASEGFIAHELAEVVPDAVTGEKDAVSEDGSIKPQGIDTSFLVATLTAAIQEQQALIQSLTQRIAALEGAA